VAEAARNIVFVLILNAIRDAYFAHAVRVPVTADPRALAPRYTRLAAAIERRDADEAAATAFALAAQQTAWVREALAR
jgi:DNA-binding FadR family transcriptional regulator